MTLPKTALPVFLVALAFTLFMALDPSPPHMPMDGMGDKFEHMLAFTTLSLLGRVAFPRMDPWRLFERLSFLGALIEVFQAIPALHRDCDWHDWVADTLAAGVTIWLTIRFVRFMPGGEEYYG